MGTNYYWYEKDTCKCCGRDYDPKHIGKSSIGWCFGLHVYPEEGIETLDDWKKLFKKKRSYIKDEYGDIISSDEIISIITDRYSDQNVREMSQSMLKWCGVKSVDEFLIMNHAVIGPNNLIRHMIEDHHCIGHGEGTWDYMIGDFS